MMEVKTADEMKNKRVEHEHLATNTYQKAGDVAKKIEIVKRILSGLEERQLDNCNTKEMIKQLTGVPEEILEKAYDSLDKVNPQTFAEIIDKLKERQPSETCDTINLDYKVLREVIFDFYIEKRIVPTADNILRALEKKISSDNFHETIALKAAKPLLDGKGLNKDILMKQVKRQGFKWKQVPNSTKCIIIEDPEKMYRRTIYLQKMRQYRMDKRCFIYVQYSDLKKFAASPALGLINKCDNVSETSIDQWASAKLVAVVPQSSVIVVSSSQELKIIKQARVPRVDSPKVKMIGWLKAHNIPCKESLHRSDLFKLIEAYKSRTLPCMTVLEALLNSHGHEMLLTPPELSCLDYFEFLNDLEKHGMDIMAAVSSLKPEDWVKLDINLSAIEANIYDEDMKFDTIVDQVLTMAKYEGIDDSEMDTYDKNANEHYYSNIISF